jgi:ribose 5-phosphate isomerase B
MGARAIGPELALDIVRVFLAAKFTHEERHLRRLAKIAMLEESRG